MKKDLEDAAGELLVELPEPGTVTAKLLSANVLLRRKFDHFNMLVNLTRELRDNDWHNSDVQLQLEGVLREVDGSIT